MKKCPICGSIGSDKDSLCGVCGSDMSNVSPMNETIEQSELDVRGGAPQEKPLTGQMRKAVLSNLPGIVLSLAILIAGFYLADVGSAWGLLLILIGFIVVAGVVVGRGPEPPRTGRELIRDIEEIEEEKEKEESERSASES